MGLDVYETKSSEDLKDVNREELLNICRMVLPPKVESLYVDLSKYFKEYLSACNSINLLNGDSFSKAKTIRSNTEKAEDASKAQAEIMQQISGLYAKAMETQSSRDLLALEKLVQQAGQVAFEKERYSRIVSNSQSVYLNNDNAMLSERQNIEKSLAGMLETLKSINGLDIDGQKRIDRLGITEKHLDLIEDLPISKAEKDALKNTLVSYTSMRIQSFKAIEAGAYNAIKAYQEHKLLDGFDDKVLANSNVAVLASDLIKIDSPIFEPYVSPVSCDEINNHAAVMSFVAEYLATGVYDEERFNGLLDKTICYPYREALLDVRRKNLAEQQSFTK